VLISSNVDVLTGLLEEYKPCFSKPQFRNFSTYTLGLIACEGKKNIDAINRCFINAKDQSSLNRFLTHSPWSLQRLENKRLQLARTRLPTVEGSTGYFIIDDTINRKTGKHMEEAGYHFDSAEGKAVWGHDIVTTHYVNGKIQYPVRLSLYLKKETCRKEQHVFKTKIELAIEQINTFTPPAGTKTIVPFDSWYFCRQIVDAVTARGWDWVTQAESNRIIHCGGEELNVTDLARQLSREQFKTVKVKGEAYSLFGLKVWMQVRDQCFRRLVDWIYRKFRHQAKPQTIYRELKI
jgi:hypothetical protein